MKATFSTPAQYPVAIADVRSHCRIGDSNPDDAILTAFMEAAWKEISEFTMLSFITRTVTLTVDHHELKSNTLWLPYGPVQSITSVTNYDSDDNSYTIASTNYILDGDELIGYNSGFRYEIGRFNKSLQVVYVAGFGDSRADIPEDVQNAIMQRVNDLYLFRQSALTDETIRVTPNSWTELLAHRRHQPLV